MGNIKLQKFIYNAVKMHNTSIGDNKALPQLGDVNFEYKLVKKRFSEVISNIQDVFGEIPQIDEASNLLSSLIVKAIEEEKPLRSQLENLCKNIVNISLGTPQETINLDCKLVDKVTPKNPLRIMPEDDGNYDFNDYDELDGMNNIILQRRFCDALVIGASYSLMVKTYKNSQINEWNKNLIGLYTKIIALNDFLLFMKQEKITDSNPMQGAYVSTYLGHGSNKTEISSQGLIFPLLLQETFRGFFELFMSHGLPSESDKALYIIHHADFLLAEPWDLRIGVPMFDKIYTICSDNKHNERCSNLLPYVYASISQLERGEFNTTLKNVLANTNKGKMFIKDIIEEVKHDAEYATFKNDIEKIDLDKSLITDEINN